MPQRLYSERPSPRPFPAGSRLRVQLDRSEPTGQERVLLGRERDRQGFGHVAQMRWRPRWTDDGRSAVRVRHYPRQGQGSATDPARRRELLELVERVVNGPDETLGDSFGSQLKATAGGKRLTASIFPGQYAPGQGREGCEAETSFPADSPHLAVFRGLQ